MALRSRRRRRPRPRIRPRGVRKCWSTAPSPNCTRVAGRDAEGATEWLSRTSACATLTGLAFRSWLGGWPCVQLESLSDALSGRGLDWLPYPGPKPRPKPWAILFSHFVAIDPSHTRRHANPYPPRCHARNGSKPARISIKSNHVLGAPSFSPHRAEELVPTEKDERELIPSGRLPNYQSGSLFN
jgi:hypothetical protein